MVGAFVALYSKDLEKGEVMKRRSLVSVKTLVLAGFGLLLIGLGTNHARLTRAEANRTFILDVAEDCNDFTRNAVDPNEDPADLAVGDTVIVGGTIFPGGALLPGAQGNLPTDPGSIGHWKSRAVMLAHFDHHTGLFSGSPIAFATMLYSLPNDSRLLISEGLVPDVGLSTRRAVIGGTGAFSGASGEVRLDNIGTNGTGCFNYRFTFKLKDAD